ncbi:hypothetical protein EDD15DRAFT_2193506 [Pisolithus albus]|nr:hypothetical protein EDD15DRAFT_2193506 [Pisolithus albus]
MGISRKLFTKQELLPLSSGEETFLPRERWTFPERNFFVDTQQAMACSGLFLKDFRTCLEGIFQFPDLDKFPLSLFLLPPVEMSSPSKLTEHRDEGGVDTAVIAELANFLSGLSLNQLTANAAIMEIWALAHPFLFGTPPPSPVTFPVSPHSSHDSLSSRVQTSYASIDSPAPSPLTPFKALHMCNKQPATSARGLLAVQATSSKVQDKPTVVSVKPTMPASPQSTSLAFTTAFGNDHITSSGFTISNLLRTFILEMAKGEKRWQQRHRGTYFDVPGPDVARPYYLVTKGAWISILSTWTRTAPSYVISIRGACYVGVSSVKEGITQMMKAIEMGEAGAV